MKATNVVQNLSRGFMGLCILSLAYVAIMAMFNPQATMDLVQVKLTNTDAISSIRGIYGGVGLLITWGLVYLLFRNVQVGLMLLSLFWGAYAFSRVVTWLADGALGAFGSQWLMIESVFALLALGLWLAGRRSAAFHRG